MKAKFGAIVTDGRGKLGGSVFSKNRYGLYEKSKVTPINTPSAYKSIIKNNHKTVVSAWSNLTDAERQSWNSGTYNFPQKNTFSDTCYLSGYALFLKLNLNRLLLSQSLLHNCPTTKGISNIIAAAVQAFVSINKLILSYNPPPPVGFVYKVYATTALSAGINYSNRRFKLIGLLQPSSASPFDLSAFYLSRFSSLGYTGNKIFVKLTACEIATGFESVPIVFSTLIQPVSNYQPGVNWTSTNQLFAQSGIYSIVELEDSTLFAGTNTGGLIIKSTDHGVTWQSLGNFAGESNIICMIYLGNGIILAGTSAHGHILRSTNYGATWTDLGTQAAEVQISCLCNCVNGIILAGTQSHGHILRSTDYGATWADLGVQFAQTGVRSICYLGNGILIAGTSPSGYILRSTDYGLTWSSQGSPVGNASLMSCSCNSQGVVLMGNLTINNILRSTDYGLTWSNLGIISAGNTPYCIVFITDSIVLIGTSGSAHMLRSTDAGLTWSDLGSKFGTLSIPIIQKGLSGLVFAGTTNNGNFLKSTL